MLSRDDFMAFMGVLAGIVSLLAYIPYISAIIRRKTIPSRTTWWILFVIGSVMLVSYRGAGASDTMLFLVGDVLGTFLVALLSLLYGKDGFRYFDKACFLSAVILLGLLFFSRGSAEEVFFLSLSIEVIAMVPTIWKTFFNPEEEDVSGWFFTFFASVINLYAIDAWSLVIAVYPFYEFFINGVIVFLLSRRRKGRIFVGWSVTGALPL